MIEIDPGYGTLAEAAKVSAEADAAATLLADRRRPGRIQAHPVLVPLLRGEPVPAILDITREPDLLESDWEPVDALRPARGIAFGLLLSLPLWAALLATCHVAIKMITQS